MYSPLRFIVQRVRNKIKQFNKTSAVKMSKEGCVTEERYKKILTDKSISLERLNEMDKEELIETILKVEAHNVQLKNLIKKKSEEDNNFKVKKFKKSSQSSSSKRHILLKFFYLGWDSKGLAYQEDPSGTIEFSLFQALERCCLIESRLTCNYQRCGRTDKGVSALSQVVSLDVRSRLDEPNAENCALELPYVSMINRLLPDHIKCYAWAHVDPDFNARFDCTSRTYYYYFPKGELNIELMREAAKHFIGEHDFRNFCKIGLSNCVNNFNRRIVKADIESCSSMLDDEGNGMYKLVIKGNSFLWHQIRNIMAVLFLVGQDKESPEIIKELLDIEKNPAKPQYNWADHLPLILFSSDYNEADIKWIIKNEELFKIINRLQEQSTTYSIKEVMIKEMTKELLTLTDVEDVQGRTSPVFSKKKSKPYKPLLEKMKCETLEDRIERYVKEKKIIKYSIGEQT